MDWHWLTALIGGPTGLAFLGWLARRKGWQGHWLRRRLTAEKNLAQCEEELENRTQSWARQEAGLLREVTQREKERDSIAAALKQLSDAVDVVNEARNAGVLTPSLTVPVRSQGNLSPGPTRRRVKRIAARSTLPPPEPSIPKSKGNRDESSA